MLTWSTRSTTTSSLRRLSAATTRYLAVSASLQWGPWGPPGYFRELDGLAPVRMTDDATIAIYRMEDLRPIAAIPEQRDDGSG